EKVRFAETLLAHEKRAALVSTAPETAVSSRADQVARDTYPGRRRGFFELMPQWGFATAAMLLLIAAALLLIQNRKLSMQIAQVEGERARLAHNQQELEKQLQEQRAVGETAPSNSFTPDGALTKMQLASVPVFVLSPVLRGAGPIA